MSDQTKLVYVCDGGDCTERGSGDIHETLKQHMLDVDPDEERVRVRRYPCFGGCECGVNVTVAPDRVFYSRVTLDDLHDIEKHLLGEGPKVERLTGKVDPEVEDMAFMMLDSPY